MKPGEMLAERYQLIRKVAEGGMGEVWLGMQVGLGREVAIKLIRPAHGGEQRELAARFQREAQLAARIRHRNVIEIYEYGAAADGSQFLVMPFLQGLALDRRLATPPAPSVREILHWTHCVLSGLGAIHAQGIIHRDLKPANVFLAKDHDGVVPKLLDFGISRSAEDAPGAALTRTGTSMGTPQYMAPEQFESAHHADQRADLYSVGAMLYEALSGRLPYLGEQGFALYHEILTGEAPPLASLRPDLPPPLCALVHRALARQPAARFASAQQMREALEQIDVVSADCRRWSNFEARYPKTPENPAMSEHMLLAFQHMTLDPHASLNKVRSVFELFLQHAYLSLCDENLPQKHGLNDLLSNSQFKAKLQMPERLMIRAQSIQRLGNVGSHLKDCNAADAKRSFDDLVAVLRWFFVDWQEQTCLVGSTRLSHGAPPPSGPAQHPPLATAPTAAAQPQAAGQAGFATAPTAAAQPQGVSQPAHAGQVPFGAIPSAPPPMAPQVAPPVMVDPVRAQSTLGQERRGPGLGVIALGASAVVLLLGVAGGTAFLLTRPEPENVTAAVASAPAPRPAATPAQLQEAEDAAVTAYRGSLASHDRRQPARYFASYMDPMQCFMGQASFPLAGLHRLRDHEVRAGAPAPRRGGSGMWSTERRVLSSSPDQVVLMDWGVWHSDADIPRPGGGTYEKLILMKRVGADWRIDVETDRAHAGCVDAGWFSRTAPPRTWARCDGRQQTCAGRCSPTCDACQGTCAECRSCTDACLCELARCFGNRHSSFCQ